MSPRFLNLRANSAAATTGANTESTEGSVTVVNPTRDEADEKIG